MIHDIYIIYEKRAIGLKYINNILFYENYRELKAKKKKSIIFARNKEEKERNVERYVTLKYTSHM